MPGLCRTLRTLHIVHKGNEHGESSLDLLLHDKAMRIKGIGTSKADRSKKQSVTTKQRDRQRFSGPANQRNEYARVKMRSSRSRQNENQKRRT
jgi:hypothetical protein